MDDPAIDLAHLERITFGDRGLRRSVLALFRDEYAGVADRLRSAEAAGPRDEAHRLRGASAGIGAFRLAAVAAAIEEGGISDAALAALDAALVAVLRSIDALS